MWATCFRGALVLTHLHCGYTVPGVLDEDGNASFKGVTCAAHIRHAWYRCVRRSFMIRRSRKPPWSHLLLSISPPWFDDLEAKSPGASRPNCSWKGKHSISHGVLWVVLSEYMVLKYLWGVTGGITSTMYYCTMHLLPKPMGHPLHSHISWIHSRLHSPLLFNSWIINFNAQTRHRSMWVIIRYSRRSRLHTLLFTLPQCLFA
jgi:hypothetical protein